MSRDERWQEQGACVTTYDPDLWAVSRHDRLQRHNYIAIAICRTCPVRQQCRRDMVPPNEIGGGAMIAAGRIWSARYGKGYRVMTTQEAERFTYIVSTTRHSDIPRRPSTVVP